MALLGGFRFDSIVKSAREAAEEAAASDENIPEIEPLVEEEEAEREPGWGELQEEARNDNKEALECLRRGATAEAFEKLHHAQELLFQAERVCPMQNATELASARAAMESSFAICNKRDGNKALAVRHLVNALELYETAEADSRTLMATRLNLSACYADAEMLSEALEHARAAVTIGGQLIAATEAPAEQSDAEERRLSSDAVRNARTLQGRNAVAGISFSNTVRPDDYAMLAVAYHKSAETHERLKQWGQATLAYTQAYEVVRRSLGPSHHLTKAFEKSARCPRRPVPPEVPLSWRIQTVKKLPHLPHIDKTLKPAPQEPLSYRLDPGKFPSWPPKVVSEEEKPWYKLAEDDRRQKRNTVINQIRDPKRAGGRNSAH